MKIDLGWLLVGVLIGLVVIALTGCSSVPSQNLVINEQINIPLVEYSPEFQSEAAGELRSMQPACPINRPGPECSEIHTMVDDYGRLRAELRAIQ